MEPTNKSEEIEVFLAGITGKDRKSIIRSNACTTCDGDAAEFKDELSRKEYTISGMCQKCQDSVFEQDDEDDWDEYPTDMHPGDGHYFGD